MGFDIQIVTTYLLFYNDSDVRFYFFSFDERKQFPHWLDLKRVYPSFYHCCDLNGFEKGIPVIFIYAVTSREVGEGIKRRGLLAPKTTNTHVGFRVTDKNATFKRCPISRFPKSSCLTISDQTEKFRSNRFMSHYLSERTNVTLQTQFCLFHCIFLVVFALPPLFFSFLHVVMEHELFYCLCSFN